MVRRVDGNDSVSELEIFLLFIDDPIALPATDHPLPQLVPAMRARNQIGVASQQIHITFFPRAASPPRGYPACDLFYEPDVGNEMKFR
jgi:hypothetical protein